MIEQDPKKKKKRGLSPMSEKLGLGEGSEYVTPASAGLGPMPGALAPPPTVGIIPTPEQGLNERDQKRNVGSKVRDRMTGRV
jgi:hypothetical protein